MKIEFQDGLLFTSIQISFRGITKVIDNVVIDTGAAESIISADAVEDLGIFVEPEDSVNSFYGVGGSLHNFFSKDIDEIKLGHILLDKPKMDFGVIDSKGDINGLLGLDLLMKIGAVIDLNRLTLTSDA
ncbi:retropepsin-like aspartic protease [Desulfitobacterium sp.]|uniref:retropepsin-like aspartic protease n=1 Tax=Desulfitobacterium sp. TaxID=49981 RepID=UPI002BDCB020|nr:retropepsin-like aspartic protease [Desulfitobacterium sp.]HVJ48950.1 retropepsin-like aspartic protease [Desulfitobacterium sp.]